MASPIKELRSRGEAFDVKLRLTAQHRELLDQVIKTFSIDPALYTRMANAVNPHGDGQASKRIVDHLAVAGENLG